MSWLGDFQDGAALRGRAARTFSFQIGLANPLWIAYGAAASAGAAWWLMAKSWAPVNIEAQVVEAEPVLEPVLEAAPEAGVESVVEAVVEPVADAVADDLTRLVGIGPRTAQALAERGVATFADLATWTAEDLAAFDAELQLKGRSARNAWLDQARALAAG